MLAVRSLGNLSPKMNLYLFGFNDKGKSVFKNREIIQHDDDSAANLTTHL